MCILRIKRRRIDFGENVALFYLGAVVFVPHLHVARDLGINRRFEPGGDVAGENDGLAGRSRLRMDNSHGRYGVFERLHLQCGSVAFGFIDAIANVEEEHNQHDEGHEFISETAHHEARSFWRAIRLL